jgi:hypothetical protein
VAVGSRIAGPNLASAPIAITSTDGGTTWSIVPLPIGTPINFGDVACPTDVQCFAVTNNLFPDVISMALTKGQWSTRNEGPVIHTVKPQFNAPVLWEDSITCISGTRCMVVGGGDSLFSQSAPDVNLTEDGGMEWDTLDLGSLTPVSVDCPRPTFCAALDVNVTTGLTSEINPDGLSDAIIVSKNETESWSVVRPRVRPTIRTKVSN